VLYPGGLPVGSEPFWGNWLTPLPALSDDSTFAENFLKYLAFVPDAGPLYSSAQFDFDKDLPRMASAARLFSATTFNPAAPADLPATDLSAFANHGGKLIIYHDLSWLGRHAGDAPTDDSVLRRHCQTRRRHGAGKGLCPSVHDTGMDHCGVFTNGPGIADTGVDLLTALEGWVEKGAPPDQLLATKTDDKGQTLWQRPVCALPQTAVYRSGDPALAASHSCAESP
jgi:hypothetical protein